MSDERIGELLRGLGRERAAPGFTEAVLARLEAEDPDGAPAEASQGAAGAPGGGRGGADAGSSRRGRPGRLRWPVRRPALGWTAAAAAAVGLAVLVGLPGGPAGTERPEQVGREQAVTVGEPEPERATSGAEPGDEAGGPGRTAGAAAMPGDPPTAAGGPDTLSESYGPTAAADPGGHRVADAGPARSTPAPVHRPTRPASEHAGETRAADPRSAAPERSGETPVAVAAGAPDPAALAEARAALAEVRERRQRFTRELALLPEIAGDGDPVLYLGGDEGLELVLDLGHPGLALTTSGGAGGGGVRPAVDRPDRPNPPRMF